MRRCGGAGTAGSPGTNRYCFRDRIAASSTAPDGTPLADVSAALDALRADLAGRYAIEREVGRGGAATVWLARDLRHDRPVALKVLLPSVAATIGPERFLREIRIAARLQHPNILTVLDSGESAGQFWFTMPFVDGESLRDRLRRTERIGLDEGLRIVHDAGLGLQYAHEQGVVHRDVKPENILLTADGRTLVVDFGIARSADAGDDAAALTVTGLAIGTPAYMSPEQATGTTALDARTDVYSLAAVAYELLVGAPPHTGSTPAAVIGKRLSEPPPRIRTSRPEIPLGVEEAIDRALTVDRDERFATVRDFLRALETGRHGRLPEGLRGRRRFRLPRAWAWVAASALVLAAGLVWQAQRGRSVPGVRRLAVLPFENLGDTEDAYFADGMTDAVRAKLSVLPHVQVIAWSSSSQYRDRRKPVRQIGRELGVDYVLVGRVRWVRGGAGASRVHVSPELVRVRDEVVAWQDGFEASLTDVFRVQGEVAGRVAQALDVALGAQVRARLASRPTANLDAYDAFLQGDAVSMQMAAPDPAALARAIAHYERAIAADSGFVEAWAQLARARSYLYFVSAPSPTNAELARRAAERARVLGPDRPEGFLALGYYHQLVRADAAAAVHAFEAGRALAPQDARLLSAQSAAERDLGRWDDALVHARQAVALDPRSSRAAASLAYVLLWLRRYDEALEACRRARALAPGNIDDVQLEAMVHLGRGDLAAAQATVRPVQANIPPDALIAYMAVYFDLWWVLDAAQQERLLALPPDAFEDEALRAMAFAQLLAARGQAAASRAYADSARHAIEAQLVESPDDGQRHVLLGMALAYLGRFPEAIAEARRGNALLPASRDAWTSSYLEQMTARIHAMAGNRAEATAIVASLLRRPSMLSPGWLRIDPTFAPLRGTPAFDRLLAPP